MSETTEMAHDLLETESPLLDYAVKDFHVSKKFDFSLKRGSFKVESNDLKIVKRWCLKKCYTEESNLTYEIRGTAVSTTDDVKVLLTGIGNIKSFHLVLMSRQNKEYLTHMKDNIDYYFLPKRGHSLTKDFNREVNFLKLENDDKASRWWKLIHTTLSDNLPKAELRANEFKYNPVKEKLILVCNLGNDEFVQLQNDIMIGVTKLELNISWVNSLVDNALMLGDYADYNTPVTWHLVANGTPLFGHITYIRWELQKNYRNNTSISVEETKNCLESFEQKIERNNTLTSDQIYDLRAIQELLCTQNKIINNVRIAVTILLIILAIIIFLK